MPDTTQALTHKPGGTTMPRQAGRAPTLEDLTPEQQEIYEALPVHLQTRYLATLPQIHPSAKAEQDAKKLNGYLSALTKLSQQAQRRVQELTPLVQKVQTGAVPLDTSVFTFPNIDGISLKYALRGRRSGAGASTQGSLPGTSASASTAEKVTVEHADRVWEFPILGGKPSMRGRSTDERKAAFEKAMQNWQAEHGDGAAGVSDEEAAPWGRDSKGNAHAPLGVNPKSGLPYKQKGRSDSANAKMAAFRAKWDGKDTPAGVAQESLVVAST